MRKFYIWYWIVPLLSVSYLAAVEPDLRLVDAVKRQDRAQVISLLNQHADPNVPEADGTTALAWAALWDDLETAELLIRAGAAVNAANEYGSTALSQACSNGNAAMVEKLLKNGADPNFHLPSGETALMTAAETGSVDVVQLLVAHGANVNAKETRAEQTALMWAVAERHPDVVRVLIEHRADVRAHSRNGFTPLLFAAQQGQVDSAQMLLAAGADINEAANDGTTPLLMASASGQEQFLLFLLGKGVNVNAADVNGYTVLHYAATRANMLESVKALLAHGANPNARLAKDPAKSDSNTVFVGATPFFLAAQAHNLTLMRLLASSGADPLLSPTETVYLNGSNGYRLQMVANTTPLMVAAGAGRYKANYPEFTDEEEKAAVEAVKLALELGSNINAANEYGQTALHAAVYLRADILVRFLVENGAKMDVIDTYGQTPLSIASRVYTVGVKDSYDLSPRRANKSTADLLLKLGATPIAASGVQVLDDSSSQ